MNIQDLFPLVWTSCYLLAVQGTLKSLLQHHSSKASILCSSAFFIVQLSYPYMTTGRTKALARWTFVGKVMSLLFSTAACNAEDPSLIPGLGSSPGEGIGYPLQYSWASLVAQMVKNLPAIRETRVHSLGWEDALEGGMAIHSSILAWRIPWA